ncbi:MAG: aconitate hydratase AcnA [Armatimonadota bacterium]|nr:aconitate hydratase AcnA [Armatimonadota bacterium]MDR7486471.1 aconitate hydratase AcnA [Armatimonadota bacterium]MDR7532237.1 aconitate hydratase AcnA [Armatimonadota bacterium]MDR7537188.1 aconitate hydratase AcnA [Armatimonadota bacterium]
MHDPFGARARLEAGGRTVSYVRLAALRDRLATPLERLPVTVKILLENVLRHCGTAPFTDRDVLTLAAWAPGQPDGREFPFLPSRVVLQDFTGVPAVVDLAAMRSAMARLGGDPERINPLMPTDLVIDHSVQVDMFGSAGAFMYNVQKEYERNRERYALLRWAQQAFWNFRVVPPGTGIVHQVNLEYLASVVGTRDADGEVVAFPDTLVGTDSHTTMINGLGVLGWGVGGIEAEAAMLGQPLYLLRPAMVGFQLVGTPPEGVTATDLVLTVTQMLRQVGVVDKFVEFFGASTRHLSLPDRATIANMSPEFGATATLFPIDAETLRYLTMTGRPPAQVALVEAYAKAQGLWRDDDAPDPVFDQVVTLDLATLEPSLAGPRRPQDRVALAQVRASFTAAFAERLPAGAGAGGVAVAERPRVVPVKVGEREATLTDGSVVIAAITSCTNTSNPAVMLAAGLLAQKAVARGLTVPPTVKTSLAPGSAVVTAYLERAGLLRSLEALGFHLVGYGCTTCIGNSGPLPEPVAQAVATHDLVVAAVLSGNRNFEGRIHPQVRAAYLASPPLVVAYALAGTVDIDLTREPLGHDRDGQPVYLRDLWPSTREVQETMARAVSPDLFVERYRDVFTGDETWRTLPVPTGALYAWDPASTYVQEPPFFTDLRLEPAPPADITGARVLVLLGDSITTDHISPAGSIPADSPAGRYLLDRGVARSEFNSYGARRGNHEVMIRGTFANIRLRNRLAPGQEGGWTTHFPSGDLMTIYDAVVRYRQEGVPLLVIAGKEYGSGSSRDWAAKGPMLQGVRATLAESYERIHRSNLVGMGVLPLQFEPGQSADSLGLSGQERYDVVGLAGGLTPGQRVTVHAHGDGRVVTFQAIARIDSPMEVEYYRHGGVLPMVLRRLLAGPGAH